MDGSYHTRMKYFIFVWQVFDVMCPWNMKHFDMKWIMSRMWKISYRFYTYFVFHAKYIRCLFCKRALWKRRFFRIPRAHYIKDLPRMYEIFRICVAQQCHTHTWNISYVCGTTVPHTYMKYFVWVWHNSATHIHEIFRMCGTTVPHTYMKYFVCVWHNNVWSTVRLNVWNLSHVRHDAFRVHDMVYQMNHVAYVKDFIYEIT